MLILFFGISRQFARSDITAEFALPFSAAAVIRTFNVAPSQPAITLFDEPGTTLILILARSTTIKTKPCVLSCALVFLKSEHHFTGNRCIASKFVLVKRHARVTTIILPEYLDKQIGSPVKY